MTDCCRGLGAVNGIPLTAIWAAQFRARESTRNPAVIQDPFAAQLSDIRHGRVETSLPFTRAQQIATATRARIIDRLLTRHLNTTHTSMVLNLGAGLDARPWRLPLPASLNWVEVDYPSVIAYKNKHLAAESASCVVTRVGLDLADVEARRRLFAELAGRASDVLVISEGLLMYLLPESAGSLALDLARHYQFQHWIADVAPAALVDNLNRQKRARLREAGVRFRFAPRSAPRFFKSHNWIPAAVRILPATRQRLMRPVPHDSPRRCSSRIYLLINQNA